MRTELQKPYIKRIDALNDQLWYYLFTSEELNRQLANYSNKAKEVFTTDLFLHNPFSKKIHVKAINLQKHQDENKRLTFGSYLSTCYEIATGLVKDLFDKLKATNSLVHYSWNNSKEPEKNLKELFIKNALALPHNYLFDTLTYIRLRRNHFIHIIQIPNPKLSGFIGSTGNSLNIKWKNTNVVKDVDFNSLVNLSDFTPEETIELIKILRICVIELDAYIASILDLNEVVKQIVEQEYGDKKVRLNADIRKERGKRIVSIAQAKLGLSITETQAEPHVKAIGAK